MKQRHEARCRSDTHNSQILQDLLVAPSEGGCRLANTERHLLPGGNLQVACGVLELQAAAQQGVPPASTTLATTGGTVRCVDKQYLCVGPVATNPAGLCVYYSKECV